MSRKKAGLKIHRNGNQWFVTMYGRTKRQATEYGPYESVEAAQEAIKGIAATTGRNNPPRVQINYNGPKTSNTIPVNATKPVIHQPIRDVNPHSKNQRQKNRRRNQPVVVNAKSFEQTWREGIRRFLPDFFRLAA